MLRLEASIPNVMVGLQIFFEQRRLSLATGRELNVNLNWVARGKQKYKHGLFSLAMVLKHIGRPQSNLFFQ